MEKYISVRKQMRVKLSCSEYFHVNPIYNLQMQPSYSRYMYTQCLHVLYIDSHLYSRNSLFKLVLPFFKKRKDYCSFSVDD